MHVHTTVRSWTAIVLGVFFAGVSGVVLAWDVHSISDFNTDHLQVLASLVGAIAAGHFAVSAYRQRLYVWAAMLALAFCIATLNCAVTSAGRGAEVAQKKALEADRVNAIRADTVSELAKARASRKEMTERFARECQTGAGQRCGGLKTAVDHVDSHVALLEARVERLQAEQVGNPKIQHSAKMLSFFFGFNQAKAEEGLSLALPFMLPLITELLSISFFGLGLGHRTQHLLPVSADRKAEIQARFPAISRKPRTPDEQLVLNALQRAGRPLSNEELAEAMKTSVGEASKRRQVCEASGIIRTWREGRYLMIEAA